MHPLFATVERIAVLRANAIGDFVFGLPALEALRAAYPNAHILLLGLDWHVHFLHDRPGPWDEVMALPDTLLREGPGATAPEARACIADLQARRLDLAVQLHGGGRQSNPLLLALGARHTVGRCSADAAPLERWLAFHHWQHEILRHLETVALAGASPALHLPQLTVCAADRQQLWSVFPDVHERYVVLNVGAGDPRRRWTVSGFACVGRWLLQQGLRLVITGHGEEATVATALQAELDGHVVSLCNQLSLGGLLALLQGAALVISNDSGPVHLAQAVGTPTVTLFWGPNVITAAPLDRRRHRIAVSWQMQCPTCGHDFGEAWPYRGEGCLHPDSLLQRIPPAEVVEAAAELLAGH